MFAQSDPALDKLIRAENAFATASQGPGAVKAGFLSVLDSTSLVVDDGRANPAIAVYSTFPDTGSFTLHKTESDLLELRLDDSYDLVYYDAFSPAHQPELWSFDVLQKIYDACNRNAVLVTSCAKPEVAKTLEAIGFEVQTLVGSSGSKKMIRAMKF